MVGLASGVHAQDAQSEGLFDRLFGSEAASERSGEASDGLSLPSLFADGKRITDALPLYDLASGEDSCIAISPLLDALELRYEQADASGDLLITLPDPRRIVTIPRQSLLPSASGECVKLSEVSLRLPFSLNHDAVSQRILLDAREPIPVLMRLIREERQAKIRTETRRPAFPLLPPPSSPYGMKLWSADLSAEMAMNAKGVQSSSNLIVSGELAGLAGRLSLSLNPSGRILPGFTVAEARETSDLLGPLKARSLAIGDVVAPSQPLIAGAMTGRGLVVSSRTPWRADLVDEITLSGPLPSGWEAELWHEQRLIAVARTPDAAGNWQFGDVPVRLGENRWTVRLYGPHGEVSEQVFNRLVGAAMNAENELDYTFGILDAGRPLLAKASAGAPSAPTAFATLGLGVTGDLTARLDTKVAADGPLSMALGLNGVFGGGLWSTTAVRFGDSSYGGAFRYAREIGSQDIVIDIARHAGRFSSGVPQQVRELSQIAAVTGQGRIGFGGLSVPWQARLESSALRSGDSRHLAAARVVLPLDDVQFDLAFGATRIGHAPWQGTSSFGLAIRRGDWRLRGAVSSSYQARWQVDGASLSASRRIGTGSMALNLNWDAQTGVIAGGMTLSQQVGNIGFNASLGHEGQGWMAGIGINLGFWNGPRGWRTAQTGITRNGAILGQMFVDENNDGLRGLGEQGIEGGRLIVGATLRRESSAANGDVLIRGLPAGPAIDIETQMSSIEDFTLRPARMGDRVVLRPGEIRPVLIPLRPTGSLEVQVVLVAGDRRTPRSGVSVKLLDTAGREVASAVSDFDGFVLFDGLAFGTWKVEAFGQVSAGLDLSREKPDQATYLLVPTTDDAP